MVISFIFDFFEQYLFIFMFFIPYIAQMGIPIGGMFFILYSASILTNYNSLFCLFLVVLCGTVLADIVNYHIGKKISKTDSIQKVLKHKHFKSIYNEASHFIKKRARFNIFITRFLITGIGPYISYVLGMNHYNFKRFFIWVFLGEILYSAELVILGYIFSDTINEIVSIFSNFTLVCVILAGIFIIGKKIFVYEYKKHHKSKKRGIKIFKN